MPDTVQTDPGSVFERRPLPKRLCNLGSGRRSKTDPGSVCTVSGMARLPDRFCSA